MSTQTYFFRGTCKWALVHTMDTKFDTYKIDVYLDDKSKELYVESGMTMEPKTDDDGEFITFRRPDTKQIRGKTVEFGKPTVIDSNNQPTTALIGNGSSVTIKVHAFDTMNGIGHRLDAVKIDNLIVYEGKPSETHLPEGWDEDIPF